MQVASVPGKQTRTGQAQAPQHGLVPAVPTADSVRPPLIHADSNLLSGPMARPDAVRPRQSSADRQYSPSSHYCRVKTGGLDPTAGGISSPPVPAPIGAGKFHTESRTIFDIARNLYWTLPPKSVQCRERHVRLMIRESRTKIFLPSGKHRVAHCCSMFSFCRLELSRPVYLSYLACTIRHLCRGISCISFRCRTGRGHCARPWAAPT